MYHNLCEVVIKVGISMVKKVGLEMGRDSIWRGRGGVMQYEFIV